MNNLTLNNRYKLTHCLGEGGFAITFLAKDLHLPDKPWCVVKQLKGHFNDPQTKEFFRRESEVLRQLGEQHECIPRLLASFNENGSFYLVQDYIAGNNLFDYLEKGRKWPEKKVIHLLVDVLNILVFVHDQGVIHRDITPGNLILRRSDKKIFLIDFGAVKRIASYRITNTVIGTPGYIAPEQNQGNPQFASDIYSLGILAIQALTGLLPANIPVDPTTHEIVWRNQAIVTPALANVLDKMVRFNFRERPSAQQALSELNSLKNSSQIIKTRKVFPDNPKKNKFGKVLLLFLALIGVVSLTRISTTPLNAPSSHELPTIEIPEANSNLSPPALPQQVTEGNLTPLPPTTSPLPEVLESEVGIDYSQLRDFLWIRDWRSAEQETALSTCRVFGINSYKCKLGPEQVSRLPCKDLKTIDSLWTRYSNGHFGISVQQTIWQQVQNNQGSDWEVFANQIGWRNSRGLAIKEGDLIYDSNAPKGHLPFLNILKTEPLLSRAKECSL